MSAAGPRRALPRPRQLLPGRFAALTGLLLTVVLLAALLAPRPAHGQGAPPAPTGLTAKAGNAQITLAWTDPSDSTITKYQSRYQFGTSLWSQWTDISGSSASTTSHKLSGLSNDIEHTIELRAVRGSDAGASASVSATPKPPPPPAPTGFGATAGDAKVTLKWANPNDATISKYERRQRASGGNWTAWQEIIGKSIFTYTIGKLTNGTTYTFELRAVRAIYTFGPAVSATATPRRGPPFAPSGLTAVRGDRQIKWNWSLDDPPISRFQYRLSADGGTTWQPNWTDVPGSSGSTTSFVTSGLINGTEYRFEVRAVRGQLAGLGTATVGAPLAGGPSFPQSPATPPRSTPPGSTPPGSAPPGASSGGGRGGGGGGGPTPSTADFEWTVTRDIASLHAAHTAATGMWGAGGTLWIAQNGAGADDAVYAYDRASGERVAGREFALDATNRAPRGFWSDGATVWVADSGRDRLFAYDLASGERVEARDLALSRRNGAARGIWGDGRALWVLNANPSLFVYDRESGALIAEYALHARNRDPRGIWSDGVTVWVSDHGAKMLFAYRLPALPAAGEAAPEEPPALDRVPEEEFTHLSRASNNSPRGLWSDGAVMYVADALDRHVYTYNMPDAIDARLASLAVSDIEIGEFSPLRTDYEGSLAAGASLTTVAAEAAQPGAAVAIEPPDADASAAGHQVELASTEAITVTVTSGDGSRTRVYRVALPPRPCLSGAVVEGFSLVVSAGGSVDALDACARDRAVTALYALHAGAYVSYIPDAPAIVNRAFRALFADGLPALTPLVVKSDGPASADPAAAVDAGPPWPQCLRGEVAAGFSAAVYAGGSVEELDACARSHNVTALYTLHEGGWVSYAVGGPALVNRRFQELFPDGVPALTPFLVRSEGTAAPAGR